MRWAGQSLTTTDEGALPRLDTLAGLLRTVTAEEFPGTVSYTHLTLPTNREV